MPLIAIIIISFSLVTNRHKRSFVGNVGESTLHTQTHTHTHTHTRSADWMKKEIINDKEKSESDPALNINGPCCFSERVTAPDIFKRCFSSFFVYYYETKSHQ